MNRHNVFDLDWSLTFSVEHRTQFYRKSWSLFYYVIFLLLALFSVQVESSILKLMRGYYNTIDWMQLRVYTYPWNCAVKLFFLFFIHLHSSLYE